MELQYFYVVNGFLGCLEAQGWLSAFANPSPPKVALTLIAELYYSINRQSLTYVEGVVDGHQF